MQKFSELLCQNPIILAVKNEEDFAEALESKAKVIFLLFGTLSDISRYVQSAKDHHKLIFIHFDLIDGLAPHEAGVDFLMENTLADGIISTRPKLLSYAKECGFITIMRMFQLDSLSLETLERNFNQCQPDFIECLPAVFTRNFRKYKKLLNCDVIAGGLISSQQDIKQALVDGAIAVSTSKLSFTELIGSRAIARSADLYSVS